MDQPELTLAKRYIRQFEGFSGALYRCPAGVKTIGFGHALKDGEDYTNITMAEADELLDKDVQEIWNDLFADDGILVAIKNELNTSKKAAILSFVFNVGVGNFKSSTLCKCLLSKQFDQAYKEFDRWVYITKKGGIKVASKGLANRRDMEQLLFLNETV